MLFFQFFNDFLCRFASRFYQNFYCGKNTNYPLTTKKGDRFASCENIVSQSPSPNPQQKLCHFMTMFENKHIFNADMLGAKLQHRT